MKKNKKIFVVLLMIIFVIVTCIEVFAATLTTESLKKSLEEYANGTKKAHAKIGETTLAIGGSAEEKQNIEVTDSTITIDGLVFNYVIENNKVRFSYDVEVVAGEKDYLTKVIYPMGFTTLFVATTDVFGIDSDKSLYYYGSVNNSISETSIKAVPDNVDINDGLSWFKYLESQGYFKELNNNVFTISNNIAENSDEKFKYTGNLEINLNKLDIITNFEATSYEKTNTIKNTGALSVSNISKTNTSTKNDLPYSGLEDNNTFIGIALIFVGIALILYARYASLKLKEN